MARVNFKRFAAALLLTAVLIADAVGFGDMPSDEACAEANVVPFLPNLLVKGHKVYYDNGTFKGCETGGSGCWMVTTSLATVTVSGEGVHIQ